jgi:hypothetical protein
MEWSTCTYRVVQCTWVQCRRSLGIAGGTRRVAAKQRFELYWQIQLIVRTSSACGMFHTLLLNVVPIGPCCYRWLAGSATRVWAV